MPARKINYFKYKKHHPDAKIDMPSKIGDVGYDIYSVGHVEIAPLSAKKVDVGLSFELLEGYYFTVETRSKHGVSEELRAHRGIVDNGYRGVLSVKIYNHSKNCSYWVKKGEKIAQLVIHKVEIFPLLEVKELSQSERGSAGFGSTG